jgi:hypothetical protein
MDLTQNHLSLADTGIPGGATIDSLASTAKNLAAGVRNKAKAKSAQKISDQGNYWTLRSFLKGMIPIPQYVLDQVGGQGITEDMVISVEATPGNGFPSGTPIGTIIAKMTANASKNSVGTGGVIGTQTAPTPTAVVSTSETFFTKYKNIIPYVVVIAIVGIVLYFVIKHKK